MDWKTTSDLWFYVNNVFLLISSFSLSVYYRAELLEWFGAGGLQLLTYCVLGYYLWSTAKSQLGYYLSIAPVLGIVICFYYSLVYVGLTHNSTDYQCYYDYYGNSDMLPHPLLYLLSTIFFALLASKFSSKFYCHLTAVSSLLLLTLSVGYNGFDCKSLPTAVAVMSLGSFVLAETVSYYVGQQITNQNTTQFNRLFLLAFIRVNGLVSCVSTLIVGSKHYQTDYSASWMMWQLVTLCLYVYVTKKYDSSGLMGVGCVLLRITLMVYNKYLSVWIDELLLQLKATFMRFVDWLVNNVINLIIDIMNYLWLTLGYTIIWFFTALGNMVTSVVNYLSDVIMTVVDWLVDNLGGVVTWLFSTAYNLLYHICNILWTLAHLTCSTIYYLFYDLYTFIINLWSVNGMWMIFFIAIITMTINVWMRLTR